MRVNIGFPVVRTDGRSAVAAIRPLKSDKQVEQIHNILLLSLSLLIFFKLSTLLGCYTASYSNLGDRSFLLHLIIIISKVHESVRRTGQTCIVLSVLTAFHCL